MTPACPACGGDGRTVHRLSATPVAACTRCSLVFCQEAPEVAGASSGPNSILTEEAYTAGLLQQDPARQVRYDALAVARHAEYARRLSSPRFSLLEIGCGTAGLRRRLVELGVDYHGIDIDERVVEAARAAGALDVERRDVMELPDERRYDVICASQVLEHLRHPAAFVEKVGRLLVPNGLLHLDVPNHHALAGWPSRLLPATRVRYGGIDHPHHAISYTAEALCALLAGRFEAEVVAVAPDHPVWGQAGARGPVARAYFAVSRWVGAQSILVALARPAAHPKGAGRG